MCGFGLSHIKWLLQYEHVEPYSTFLYLFQILLLMASSMTIVLPDIGISESTLQEQQLRQQRIAEITEMIHVRNSLHQISIFLLFLYEKFKTNIAVAGCKSSSWWCIGQCRDKEGYWVTQFCDGKQSERLTKNLLEFPMELSIHDVNAIVCPKYWNLLVFHCSLLY